MANIKCVPDRIDYFYPCYPQSISDPKVKKSYFALLSPIKVSFCKGEKPPIPPSLQLPNFSLTSPPPSIDMSIFSNGSVETYKI